MGFMEPKQQMVIFILILVSLLSAPSTGQRYRLTDGLTVEAGGVTKEPISRSRILVVKTNDYGRYDPAPTFGKPSFKLIPN